jgi:CheY-like chemotaxis protein
MRLSAAPVNSQRVYKVLIVDDNAFNVIVMKSMMNKIGVECDVAENGFMAVDRYKYIVKEG